MLSSSTLEGVGRGCGFFLVQVYSTRRRKMTRFRVRLEGLGVRFVARALGQPSAGTVLRFQNFVHQIHIQTRERSNVMSAHHQEQTVPTVTGCCRCPAKPYSLAVRQRCFHIRRTRSSSATSSSKTANFRILLHSTGVAPEGDTGVEGDVGEPALHLTLRKRERNFFYQTQRKNQKSQKVFTLSGADRSRSCIRIGQARFVKNSLLNEMSTRL